jgi:hypothetical protein
LNSATALNCISENLTALGIWVGLFCKSCTQCHPPPPPHLPQFL